MYDISPVEALDFHHSMLVDTVRLESYLHAIMETVKPGDIVLDLGSGTGIMACLACMAGAKHVYAIEKEDVVHIARAIITANDLSDRVTFFNDWSTAVDLPEQANVLVTETIGNSAFEEGILRWVVDARKRLLQAGVRIIPQRVAMIIAPVENEKPFWQVETWSETTLYTYDFSPLHTLAANNLLWTELQPEMFLAEPVMIWGVDLRQVEEPDFSAESTFIASRDGLLHGLGGWFTADLTSNVRLSNEPPNQAPSWNHVLFPLERPLAVKAGDRLHLQLGSSHQSAHWHWQVTHYPQIGDDEEPYCIILPQGSTLAGRLKTG